MALTQERLKQLLDYNPETGVFTWIAVRRGIGVGRVAGKTCDGYRRIQIDRKLYGAHRLAFLFMNGSLPNSPVDHINVNPLDNRWLNLRIDTNGLNAQNRKAPQTNSKSGLLGASPNARRDLWVAQIKYDGVVHRLGLFKTREEAHAAYIQAKRKHHEFCTI